MEPVDVGLDSDKLIFNELRREARARGKVVLTLDEEDFALCVMYLAGLLAGIWIATAVSRG